MTRNLAGEEGQEEFLEERIKEPWILHSGGILRNGGGSLENAEPTPGGHLGIQGRKEVPTFHRNPCSLPFLCLHGILIPGDAI